jgi:SAM-dependent methyltransferase
VATLSANKKYYESYDWTSAGEEWSEPWGGTRSMWLASIYPRVGEFLPAKNVVEIGSGHGRVARILHAFATNQLVLFDIVDECVSACEKKFESSSKTICRKTDGNALQGVADNSVDFIFSFYSLVGSDAKVITGYLQEFSRVLSDDGVAFIHHSNAGMYFDPDDSTPDKRMLLLAAYRDMSIDAAGVQQIAASHDLFCIKQECINWDITEILSDCFSTIVRPASKWAREPVLLHNPEFQKEQNQARDREQARNRVSPGG